LLFRFCVLSGREGAIDQAAPKQTKTVTNQPESAVSVPTANMPTVEESATTPPRISPISNYARFIQKGENEKNSTEIKGGKIMDLELKSSAFNEGEKIPKLYTGDGADASPPLSWNPVPMGRKVSP